MRLTVYGDGQVYLFGQHVATIRQGIGASLTDGVLEMLENAEWDSVSLADHEGAMADAETEAARVLAAETERADAAKDELDAIEAAGGVAQRMADLRAELASVKRHKVQALCELRDARKALWTIKR